MKTDVYEPLSVFVDTQFIRLIKGKFLFFLFRGQAQQEFKLLHETAKNIFL